MTIFVQLVDCVALVYHEARNVRHLVRSGAADAGPWKYVLSLPTNRDKAWAAIQDTRRAAKNRANVRAAIQEFEQRFRVALPELEELYGHSAWRHSACGGNAWLAITKSVRRLAECLDHGPASEAEAMRESLLAARHNTGTVSEKLYRLDGGQLGICPVGEIGNRSVRGHG